MLQQIKERIKSSSIDIRHRDALIRLRAIIEDDLQANRMLQGRTSSSVRQLGAHNSERDRAQT